MKRPCSFDRCGERRIHHERPNEPRGTQMVESDDNHPKDQPVYCSITCACMDGAFSLTTGILWGVTTKSGYKLPDQEPKPVKDV